MSDMSKLTLKDAEAFGKSVFLQTVALYGVNKLGIDDFIARDPNMLTRNIKRGTTWYFTNAAEEHLLTGTSNFTKMDVKKLIDDSLFNSIASATVETFRLNDSINFFLERFIPRGELLDNVSTAMFIVLTRNIGEKYEDMAITKISSLFS